MSSPYTPPGAPVRDKGPEKKGSPAKAVFLGVLADLGGSFVVGVVLSAVFAANMAAGGANEQQIAAALAKVPRGSWMYISGIVLGGLCSIAGGYVCARVAKHSEYGLGAITAAISVGTGAWLGGAAYSFFENILLAALGFVLIMLGVRLGVAKNRRA